MIELSDLIGFGYGLSDTQDGWVKRSDIEIVQISII